MAIPTEAPGLGMKQKSEESKLNEMNELICKASVLLNRGSAIHKFLNPKVAKHMRATTNRRTVATLFAVLAAASIHAANAQPRQEVGFLSTLGGEVSTITSFNS